MSAPAVSIVIPTKNRADSLDRTLRSVAGLIGHEAAEVIVVDNGSTDHTPEVMDRWRSAFADRAHLLHDHRPGASNARNTGIAAATAPIVAFLDDDQEVCRDWIVLIRAALADPEVAAVGGRVRPAWASPPPAWLRGRELGGAVSIIDGGDEPFQITARRWFCLGGGNLAMRRDVLLRLGGFDATYPRSQDRELLVRLLLAGGAARYEPRMVILHHVDGARLTRARVRGWYAVEGRMRAGYSFDELFLTGAAMCPLPTATPRVLGAARALYVQWLKTLVRWFLAAALLRRDAAFRHELRLRYLAAYLRRRCELRRADAAAGGDGLRRAHVAAPVAARPHHSSSASGMA